MDHVHEQSKLDQDEKSTIDKDKMPASYYYDDATNYETYHDDDEDDDVSSSQNNIEG
jgi:hypothetical protein